MGGLSRGKTRTGRCICNFCNVIIHLIEVLGELVLLPGKDDSFVTIECKILTLHLIQGEKRGINCISFSHLSFMK